MAKEQLQLPLDIPKHTIVNVSKVKHLSPFRYPGGKTWLVPRIRLWLYTVDRPGNFYEIFAGGGIVGLSVAHEKLADHVTLIELDDQVSSVWEVILSGKAEKLAKRILEFNFNVESLNKTLEQHPSSIDDLAFQTILRNRTNRGGILARGAGRIKKGENGKGIRSRWYPETLYKRIINIHKMRDRITFIHGDGLKVFEDHAKEENACFFIDPPYTAGNKKAGKRLYTHSTVDHSLLFEIAKSVKGNFLMTYENDQKVKSLSKKYKYEYTPIAMKNTHHSEMTELLISNNLNWLSE